ncbi:hypothetical protein [Micromonospora echinospora]
MDLVDRRTAAYRWTGMRGSSPVLLPACVGVRVNVPNRVQPNACTGP